MHKTVKIITLGCSKNTVDSEKLLKHLQYSGFDIKQKKTETYPDIVIVNTCGFINDAKEESVNTIIELAEARKKGIIKELYVMGCLSERYKDELRREIPEVDMYFGVDRPDEILRYLKEDYRKYPDPDRILSGPQHYAYLKVSEGCNRNCAFCAIPGIRGRYRSAAVEELVRETEILSSKGVKELILIAQDMTYYGIDRYGKPMLTNLVRSLLDVKAIEWIRLHYLYPGSIPEDLLQLIKDNPRICNYIDIPVQHISDGVLSRMKRNHSEEETRKLLSHIRNYIPEAAIRTTLISGFPGETEDDFRRLLDFIIDFRFERLGVFTYSHEENTTAYSLTDDVPDKVKQERADLIMQAQEKISAENNLRQTGNKIPVIIDREENGYYIARSQFDSPEVDQEVIIEKNNTKLKPGDLINVIITGSEPFDLLAVPEQSYQ